MCFTLRSLFCFIHFYILEIHISVDFPPSGALSVFLCVSCLVRLVCPSEFHSLLFIILTEELQIRIIKPDITSAISASESSLLSKSDTHGNAFVCNLTCFMSF